MAKWIKINDRLFQWQEWFIVCSYDLWYLIALPGTKAHGPFGNLAEARGEAEKLRNV